MVQLVLKPKKTKTLPDKKQIDHGLEIQLMLWEMKHVKVNMWPSIDAGSAQVKHPERSPVWTYRNTSPGDLMKSLR